MVCVIWLPTVIGSWLNAMQGLGPDTATANTGKQALVLTDTVEAWGSELVVKVKEPLVTEYGYLRDQMIFTFFHLAGADPLLSETLLARGTTALAYEMFEDESGRLPLLAPMSSIAGNMASLVIPPGRSNCSAVKISLGISLKTAPTPHLC